MTLPSGTRPRSRRGPSDRASGLRKCGPCSRTLWIAQNLTLVEPAAAAARHHHPPLRTRSREPAPPCGGGASRWREAVWPTWRDGIPVSWWAIAAWSPRDGRVRSLRPDRCCSTSIAEIRRFRGVGCSRHAACPPWCHHRYDQFAVRAFEVHAVDYLVKPFDDARFAAAITRAKSAIRSARAGELSERLSGLLEQLGGGTAADRWLTRIVVKTAGRVVLVRVEEIDWIEEAVIASAPCGTRSTGWRESLRPRGPSRSRPLLWVHRSHRNPIGDRANALLHAIASSCCATAQAPAQAGEGGPSSSPGWVSR